MNETYTTLVGNLVADPQTIKNGTIRPVTRFRVAVTERSYNAEEGRAVDVQTSFYQVSAWGNLGLNAAESLRKGDRVIVQGKLSVEQYQTKEGESRTSVAVEARAVGPDLTFGSARFHKVVHGEDERSRSAAETSDGTQHGSAVDGVGERRDEDDEIPPYQEVDGLRIDPAGALAGR